MRTRIVVFALLLIMFSVWRMAGGGGQFFGNVASDMKERLSQFKPSARIASAETVKAYYPSDTRAAAAKIEMKGLQLVPKTKGLGRYNYDPETTPDNYYADYR